MPVNKSELDKAINAALNGPEIRDVRFAEYRFNIKPSTIERSGGTITVGGGEENYISRRRRLLPLRRSELFQIVLTTRVLYRVSPPVFE